MIPTVSIELTIKYCPIELRTLGSFLFCSLALLLICSAHKIAHKWRTSRARVAHKVAHKSRTSRAQVAHKAAPQSHTKSHTNTNIHCINNTCATSCHHISEGANAPFYTSSAERSTQHLSGEITVSI
jgi:ABC-type nickel/cobalt efflux system permease component RcnA